MHRQQEARGGERGTILLVIVFIATAIAALAAISSSRVVTETKRQQTLEQETRAFNSAYAQIHMAMNVVNNSAYNALNHNLALRSAMDGEHGGTVGKSGESVDKTWGDRETKVAGQETGYVERDGGSVKYTESLDRKSEAEKSWLADPDGVEHGLVEGTNVRVYRGRDYIKRLQRLKGEPLSDADPFGSSDSYFVLEAAGRSRDTVRLVSALVRENEPFSSFVFFQNRATLGVSGAPRGLIHSNAQLDFYFAGGDYVDPVSAVSGFGYEAGATRENTNLKEANDQAAPIALDSVDFANLKTKADLFVGDDGMDGQIDFDPDGTVRIRQHTPPRYEDVERSYTYDQWVGYHYETQTQTQPVKVGEREVEYQEQEQVGTETETYYETVPVKVGEETETYTVTITEQVGSNTETRYRDVQVQTGTETVTRSREDPIWDTRTVTRTRWVKVWVPYNSDDGGGTAVGGGGAGDLGEWQWVEEEYEAEEDYIAGYETVTWEEEVPVYQTVQEPYEVEVPVYETREEERTRTVDIYENQEVERTREVPVYEWVTRTRTEDVYEDQPVEVEVRVEDYEEVTVTWTEEVYFAPVYESWNRYTFEEGKGNTIYVDGRITRLDGSLNGRVTIVSNDSVKVTGNIRYTDDAGERAMENGTDYTKPYQRNADYTGNSILGVIAREDVLFTRKLPSSAEINGTLMAVEGRVGIDGFWSDSEGELVKDSSSNREAYLSPERQKRERAYDTAGGVFPTRRYRKDSLRRIGGVVSNNRILETYIRARNDGTSYVDAGFKRGSMKFDINLLFNPPPNFVEVPRPVLTYVAPIFLVRNNDV